MCRGTTTKGKPCKRKQEPYCRDHDPQKQDPTPELPYSFINVPKHAQNKIMTKIRKGPSKSDGYGHIYIYYLSADPKDFYYKIGRTSRDVDTRLKEWKDSKLRKSYRVANQKHAERLIHLYLDEYRVYRYKQDDGTYCTVWKENGLHVTDKDKTGKKEGRSKEVEWFRCKWETVKKVVEAICKE